MVRHFLSISITSGAIAVAIADIDMPLSLTHWTMLATVDRAYDKQR
jgi:hypothetical protein